jgi:hypothetical protein
MMGGVQRAEPEEIKMTRESIQPYSVGKLANFQKIGTVPIPAAEKGGDDTVCHSSESRMCGAQDMQDQVDAYQASMVALIEAVIPLGGFYWQLMDGSGARLNSGINTTVDPATCTTYLRSVCVSNPSIFKRFMLYSIPNGGKDASEQSFTDYTAEFRLTRGPYALLGYTWAGCTDGDEVWPRAKEWDEDFGVPVDSYCSETTTSGVFARAWTAAQVTWDCNAGHGTILKN